MTFEERIEQEARLRILQEMAEESDKRIAVNRLRDMLRDRWAIKKSQEWVDLQVSLLKELGALTVVTVGELRVAMLAQRGREHLAKEIELPGVQEA